MKRYQIAKVYRRDQPSISRGRLREFYQADFDIAGSFDSMVPDAEVLRVIVEAFRALELEVTIKLNNRRILDGIFTVSGVPVEKIRAISSAVDKLDKMPWAEVKREMVDEKGLAEDVADRVGAHVLRKGSMAEMLDALESQLELSSNEDVLAGIKETRLLMQYLDAMDVTSSVSFDLSLARGLDYYTGLVYEVIPRGDNQVGMYSKQAIPCVGVSFGVDRIYTILETRQKRSAAENLQRQPDVYIVAAGGKDFDGLLVQRMAIARDLWDAGIQAEYSSKVKPKLQSQFNASKDVPVTVILGPYELEAGQVRLKQTSSGADGKDRGRLVSRQDLAMEVKKMLLGTLST